MTSPNWGLAGGNGFQNALAQGVQMGQMVRQQREEKERQNALAAYAANPDDPKSTEALIKADPRLGVQVMEKQRERQAEAQLGQLTKAAMGGDKDALGQLATVSFDRWKALDGQQRESAKVQAKEHGSAALYALQSPNPRAVLQAYAQRSGDPEVAQLLQLPDDQLTAGMQEMVFEADLVGKLIELERPSYQAIPEGGTLVNTRDPAAVQSYMDGMGAPKQVKQIGGKSYYQDANGDWYEDDGGATPGGSPTFREAFGN